MKLYLAVEADNIVIIDYCFSDQQILGSKDIYPKPQCMAVCGDNSVSIFEKNGIPEMYRKMFLVTNSLALSFCPSSSSMVRKKNIFQRVKSHEFITDIPIYLSCNGYDDIYGYMASDKPTFDVKNCYGVRKDDVIRFFNELRDNDLLDNYIKTLGEIIRMEVKSNFDTNKVGNTYTKRK